MKMKPKKNEFKIQCICFDCHLPSRDFQEPLICVKSSKIKQFQSSFIFDETVQNRFTETTKALFSLTCLM